MGDKVSWYPRTTRMKSFVVTAGMLGSPCNATRRLQHFGAKCVEVSGVGRRQHFEHEIDRCQPRQNLEADELAEAALEQIPLDTRVLVFGHHEAHAGERMKGSQGTHI